MAEKKKDSEEKAELKKAAEDSKAAEVFNPDFGVVPEFTPAGPPPEKHLEKMADLAATGLAPAPGQMQAEVDLAAAKLSAKEQERVKAAESGTVDPNVGDYTPGATPARSDVPPPAPPPKGK